MSDKRQVIKSREKIILLIVETRRLGIQQKRTAKFAKTFWNKDILH